MATNCDKNVDLQSLVACDRCESHDVVKSYCLTCHGNLCDPCKDIHLNDRLLRKHRIVPRVHEAADTDRKSAPRPCQYHPNYEYVTCCATCKVPCCPVCLVQEHQGHRLSSFESASADVKKELQ